MDTVIQFLFSSYKIWIFIGLIQAFICGALTQYLAILKGYSPAKWFFCGFFCGILGLLTAIGLPLKQSIDWEKISKKL